MDDLERKQLIGRLRRNYSRTRDVMLICDEFEDVVKTLDFTIEELEQYVPDYFANAKKEMEGAN